MWNQAFAKPHFSAYIARVRRKADYGDKRLT
jgi:hypothetical protein